MTAPRLVLVGAPGAGKSTVGRRVAEQCDLPFADTDLLIEEATGMSVADIFITLGEPEFRRIEEEVVAEALREQSGILALGGGVVMSPATRLILGHHFVVWLRVSVVVPVTARLDLTVTLGSVTVPTLASRSLASTWKLPLMSLANAGSPAQKVLRP